MVTMVPVDSLRLHPDSERVPMAESSDLAALRESLREHGQQDPIDVTPDGLILDGRTRWTLLRELGAQTVQVREVTLPTDQQTPYIVDRALSRRHLNAEQKRALNALLREQVVEVAVHPTTRSAVRIGRTVRNRAETLGVEPMTIRDWDEKDAPIRKHIGADGPTHIRTSDGRINPARHPERAAMPKVKATSKRAPLRRSRPIPVWSRHFSLFCRRSRPEDREFLLRMAREIHAALRQNDIEYEED